MPLTRLFFLGALALFSTAGAAVAQGGGGAFDERLAPDRAQSAIGGAALTALAIFSAGAAADHVMAVGGRRGLRYFSPNDRSMTRALIATTIVVLPARLARTHSDPTAFLGLDMLVWSYFFARPFRPEDLLK